MANEITIFDNINGEIRRKNISQEEMCKNLGINRRKYASWQEKGDMPVSFFMKCAKYLNCSLEYLSRDVKAHENTETS